MNKEDTVMLLKTKNRPNKLDQDGYSMSQRAIPSKQCWRWSSFFDVRPQGHWKHIDFTWPHSVTKGVIICPHKGIGILDLNVSFLPSFSCKQHPPWTYWTPFTQLQIIQLHSGIQHTCKELRLLRFRVLKHHQLDADDFVEWWNNLY